MRTNWRFTLRRNDKMRVRAAQFVGSPEPFWSEILNYSVYAGDGDRNSFYRKGSGGEWIHQFSYGHKREFLEIACQTLVDLGYEFNSG